MPEHARRAVLRAAGVSRLDGSVSSAMSSHTGGILRRGVATARLLLIAVAFLSTRGSAAGVVGSEMSTGPAAYMHWPVPRPSWDGQGMGGSNGLSSHRRLQRALEGTQKSLASLYKATECFVQGAAGGAAGALTLYPFETTKVRMQAAGAAASQGFFATLATTAKKEGTRGLFKGVRQSLMGVAPEKAVMIGSQMAMRSRLGSWKDEKGCLPLVMEAAVGGIAGAGQVVFSSPKEMFMVQMQLASAAGKAASTSGGTALAVLRNLGIGGLYKGAGATLMRDVPFAAIYFSCYSRLKVAIAGENDPLRTLSFGEQLFAGTASAMPAAFLTTPADVLKTRMQAAAGSAASQSMRATAVGMVRAEGLGVLMTGWVPRVALKAPALGIALLVVELMNNAARGKGTD